jgi:hypothetical protein
MMTGIAYHGGEDEHPAIREPHKTPNSGSTAALLLAHLGPFRFRPRTTDAAPELVKSPPGNPWSRDLGEAR